MSARIGWRGMVLALPMVLAGCSMVPFVGDESSDRQNVSASKAMTVTEQWSARAGRAYVGFHRLEPALLDDQIITGAADGTVTAWALGSGERRWQTEVPAFLSGAVGAGENTVAVASTDGRVFALAADSGAIRWEQSVSTAALAPPAVGQGSVVVRTGDGRVFALEADTGAQRWLYSRSVPALSLHGHGAPVLVSGGVVAGFDNGRLSALDLQTGTPAWEATVAVPEGRTDLARMVDLDADPVVSRGELFAGTYQGRVAGLSLTSGQIAWARELSVLGGLSVDANNLYVSDAQGRITAFDRSNGASVWRFEGASETTLTAPVRHGETLAVATAAGEVIWLSPDNGEVLARHRVGGDVISAAPQVSGNTLYVLDQRGRLQALTIE